MDLKQLREETQPEHDATEAAMPLMDPELSLATYIDTLQGLLPVVRGWELWAGQNVPASLQPLLAARRRAHLLAADLRALHVPEAPGRQAVDWDRVVCKTVSLREDGPSFEAAFLGALYVVEGSTLGGRIIARHAAEVLGLHGGRGTAFFEGHGQQTGAFWRETTAAIAAVPERHERLLIAAAQRTFRVFRTNMGKLQSESPPLDSP